MNKFIGTSISTLIACLFAYRTASAGKRKIMSTLKLPSVLGAITAILSSSVHADTLALPVGLNDVSVYLEVVRTGGTTFVRESDITDPAQVVKHYSEYPYAGFFWFAELSSSQRGLQAWGGVERQPQCFGCSVNGSLTATLRLTDTIVITPSNCAANYGKTNVEFDCVIPNDDSVGVTPNVQVKLQLTAQSGAEPNGQNGTASASAQFDVNYGGKFANALWRRCLSAGLEGPVPCTSGGDTDSLSGFSLDDEDSTANGIEGKMRGIGEDTQVGISKINGGSGTFTITMTLTIVDIGYGQGDVIANAEVQTNKAFTYAISGPVFNLPEGWTAWSTSGLVQNNLYVAPPIFKDGFESSE